MIISGIAMTIDGHGCPMIAIITFTIIPQSDNTPNFCVLATNNKTGTAPKKAISTGKAIIITGTAPVIPTINTITKYNAVNKPMLIKSCTPIFLVSKIVPPIFTLFM